MIKFVTGVLVLGGLVAACSKRNPEVCCTTEADCAAQGLPVGSTCAQGLVCINNGCTQPDLDGGVQCGMDSDCDSGTPFCSPSHTCVACLDSSECANATPICDLNSHTCHGCTADADCPSSVCTLELGTCVSADAVVYAMPLGLDSNNCSQATPCSLTKAISVATMDTSHSTVRMLAGFYNETLGVSGGGAITIVATGANVDGDVGQNPAFSLLVEAGANVTIRALTLTATGSNPLSCAGATTNLVLRDVSYMGSGPAIVDSCHVLMERTQFVQGISFNNGSFTADRCWFYAGQGTGISFNGNATGTVTVTNSVMGSVGLSEGSNGAMKFAYNTIYGGGVADGGSNSPTNVTFENNIIVRTNVGTTDSDRCPTCTFTNNIIHPQATTISGNNFMDPELKDPMHGDFHLSTGSPAIDTASDATSTHDYEGTPRPQGSSSDIGALEFKP